MASKRNTILDAFKAVIDAIGGGVPAATIGILKPKDVDEKPRAEVWWHNDYGSHVDTESEQRLRVTTAIKFKYDESNKATKGATQLHQASEHYDAIHAAIETAFNSRGSSSTPFTGIGHLNIEQADPGIECDGFDDADGYLLIGEVWNVNYRRTDGATT